MNLNVEILRILDQCGGYLLPEPALLNQLRQAVVPPPSIAEFGAALRKLEGERWAMNVRPEVGGPLKWKITDAGRAVLASAS